MTETTFKVTWRPERRLLEAALFGFWAEADVAAFAREVTRTLAAAGGRPFDALADLSAVGPQSGAVIALQGELLAALRAAGLRRLMVAGAGPLLVLQVRRAGAAAGVEPLFAPDAETARRRLAEVPETAAA